MMMSARVDASAQLEFVTLRLEVENLLGRLNGPFNLRLSFLSARNGIKDESIGSTEM